MGSRGRKRQFRAWKRRCSRSETMFVRADDGFVRCRHCPVAAVMLGREVKRSRGREVLARLRPPAGTAVSVLKAKSYIESSFVFHSVRFASISPNSPKINQSINNNNKSLFTNVARQTSKVIKDPPPNNPRQRT